MGFYNDHILPRLIASTMRSRDLIPYRQRVVSQAEGRVLEIGIGAGANLPFYSNRAREIVGLEPSPRLLSMARNASSPTGAALSFVNASAEAIPVDDASFDTVLLTWTLCSVPDASLGLAEARRALKPGGRLLFVEHGRAPDARVETWQRRLTPVWKRLAGGCHLNRATASLIENAGFQLERVDTGYMRGPRPLTFMYEGSARR